MNKTHRYVLRAVIEFTTPFLVASGRNEAIADAEFVRDQNGLPMIPGTSIAGVLRAAFTEKFKEGDANVLFGYQDRDNGQGSRLSVSNACIHNKDDRPVEGIMEDRKPDDVLSEVYTPALRDHVRINHKGASAAEESGKFDEYAVCAGSRFTFEIEMSGSEGDRHLWDKLTNLICTESFRFGGNTRSGYGACRIISLKSRIFDLHSDFDAYAKHPVSLAEDSPVLAPLTFDIASSETLKIKLHAKGFWMFGGGFEDNGGESPDMVPVAASRIVWKNGQGKVERDIVVIPGSGIKGALSHRTAFYYNLNTGVFADDFNSSDEIAEHCGEKNRAIQQLFGFAKDNGQGGARGRIMIDDIYIDNKPAQKTIQHVGIDRYTGGARDQVLFNEKPFYDGCFALNISFAELDQIDAEALKAFCAAVKDLISGNLQMGAGSGRGMGYFEGEILSLPAELKEAGL